MSLENTLPSEVDAHQTVGMPQLDFSTYPSQAFWLAIALVFLFVVLRFYALPRLSRVMTARQEKIDSLLNQAGDFVEQAKALRLEITKLEQDSAIECAKILHEARHNIEKDVAEANEKTEQMVREKTSQIYKEIADLKMQTAFLTENIALNIAQTVVYKTTEENLDQDEISKLIKKAVA